MKTTTTLKRLKHLINGDINVKQIIFFQFVKVFKISETGPAYLLWLYSFLYLCHQSVNNIVKC